MTLTKARLAERIENELGLNAKHSKQAVETLLEIIKSALESGEDILISGFGKFCLKDKKPRKGRNPATGEDMVLNGRRVVTFRCSQQLRNKINGIDR